jgi:hypothetical protein
LIGRSKPEDALNKIMGIGFCEFDPLVGSETDVAYFEFTEWTEELDSEAMKLESEFGFFKNAQMWHKPFDEFPIENADE